MKSFLVRIELSEGEEQDYKHLDAEMEKRRFSTTITDVHGRLYQMPTGEYFYQGRESTAYICRMGEQAAALLEKTARILAAEVAMVAFDLQPVPNTRRSHGHFD